MSEKLSSETLNEYAKVLTDFNRLEGYVASSDKNMPFAVITPKLLEKYKTISLILPEDVGREGLLDSLDYCLSEVFSRADIVQILNSPNDISQAASVMDFSSKEKITILATNSDEKSNLETALKAFESPFLTLSNVDKFPFPEINLRKKKYLLSQLSNFNRMNRLSIVHGPGLFEKENIYNLHASMIDSGTPIIYYAETDSATSLIYDNLKIHLEKTGLASVNYSLTSVSSRDTLVEDLFNASFDFKTPKLQFYTVSKDLLVDVDSTLRDMGYKHSLQIVQEVFE